MQIVDDTYLVIAELETHFPLSVDTGEKGLILVMNRDLPGVLSSSNESLVQFDPSFSNDQKNKCLEIWQTSSEKGWLVGTSSLLMGLDYPNLRHVLFFQSFYSNLDLIQGYYLNFNFNLLGGGRCVRGDLCGQVTLLTTEREAEFLDTRG